MKHPLKYLFCLLNFIH
uniref:Uncharacterized protein n=1 Tax=Anguilla anguilla TaxID=7936 RepID=A0A0E9QFL9_ANGAN